MKTIFKTRIISFILAATFLISCSDDDNDSTNNVCKEVDSGISQGLITAFSNVAGYDDLPEYMDLETHQYTIKINTDGEICSIGYRNPSTYTGSYTMEISNVTSGNNYTGVHSFSQSATSYVSITPITVQSGDVIKVKRTILPGYGLLNKTIGRIFRKSDFTNVPYPITAGNVEFLSSDFYGAGGPVPNIGQPYITLGFKLN